MARNHPPKQYTLTVPGDLYRKLAGLAERRGTDVPSLLRESIVDGILRWQEGRDMVREYNRDAKRNEQEAHDDR